MGALSDADIRRMNLIEILCEEHEEVPEPPEQAYQKWSEEQIREYFSAGGKLPAGPAGSKDGGNSFPEPSQEVFEKWFPGLERSGTRVKHGKPRLRVLCFTPAGSSEDMYTNEGIGKRRQESPLLAWCRANNAEVFALQLPGRGRRDKEPFIKSGTGETHQNVSRSISLPSVSLKRDTSADSDAGT